VYKNASKAVMRAHWGTISARLRMPKADEEDFNCYSDRRSQRMHLLREAMRRFGLEGAPGAWDVQLFHSAFSRLFFLPEADRLALLERFRVLPKGKHMERSSIYHGLCKLQFMNYSVGCFLHPQVKLAEIFRISIRREP
jgi:hypothetical protein